MNERMDLTLERYSESIKRLPVSGKHIIGSQKESFIVAYQAFKPSIAEFAVKNQRFGGNDYSHDRMTWIKPNFLWMMYRSGWATKPGQERILAIWIKKDSFDQILNEATHSTFDPTHFSSREKWKEQLSHSEVRLQWDPDHDPYGNKIERRAIQLGIKGELLRTFTDQWIKRIEDITGFVAEQRINVKAGKLNSLMMPFEEPYVPSNQELCHKIGIDEQ